MAAKDLPPNLNAPAKMVHHADLKRLDEESAYKSECPVCPDGLLLVRRVMGVLQRQDFCIGCGQPVLYLDHTINGEPLMGDIPS